MKDFIVDMLLKKATPALGEMARGFIERLEVAIQASPNKFDDAALVLLQQGVGPALAEMWEAALATDNKIDDLVVQLLAGAFDQTLEPAA